MDSAADYISVDPDETASTTLRDGNPITTSFSSGKF